MENKSKRELFSRLLLIFGGATALIFGLSTALIQNLAYVQVTIRYWPYEQMFLEYLAFNVQLHESSFGLLISSFGGFLGLLSAVRRNVKGDLLGFAGGFLGGPRSSFLFSSSLRFSTRSTQLLCVLDGILLNTYRCLSHVHRFNG